MTSNGFQIQLLAAADGIMQWRLLSGNNRAVGRSANTYPTESTCRDDLAQLQSEVVRMDRRIRRTESHRWTWELELDCVPVARCGQPFDRLIRCEQGLNGFRTAFAVAPIAATVVASGIRSWRLASVTARVPELNVPNDREHRSLAGPWTSRDLRW